MLPSEPPKPKGGRPRVPDRAALTGIPWELVPREMGGGGSGMTCWRRLRDWHEAGVWRGITPRIARRGIDSSERLGRYRWAVERTRAWLATCRRLQIRWERRDDIPRAFLDFGGALICWSLYRRRFW